MSRASRVAAIPRGSERRVGREAARVGGVLIYELRLTIYNLGLGARSAVVGLIVARGNVVVGVALGIGNG